LHIEKNFSTREMAEFYKGGPLFRTILIGVFTLGHLYVIWRTAPVPFVSRHISKKLLVGVCVALWAVFFFALFFGHGGKGDLAVTLELLGTNWLGILFLAFVSFLAIDIITGFGLFFPRIAPLLRG